MTTPIINAPTLAQDRAAAYVLMQPQHGSYTAREIDDIARAYWTHARACGVDPAVAWAQMLHETGALSSWWSQPPRHNPAGIGVNGSTATAQPVGAWAFDGKVWRAGCSFAAGWAAQAIPAHGGTAGACGLRAGMAHAAACRTGQRADGERIGEGAQRQRLRLGRSWGFLRRQDRQHYAGDTRGVTSTERVALTTQARPAKPSAKDRRSDMSIPDYTGLGNMSTDILATDLIRALYEDAGRESDPERAAQLKRDADALRDIWSRTPYALAPTRDQMTAALGNASLNIADTMDAIASRTSQMDARVGEMHQNVQDNNTLISAFIEGFKPFQAEMLAAREETARGLGKLVEQHNILAGHVDTLEEGQSEHAGRIDSHDAQIADLQAETKALRAETADLKGRVDILEVITLETGATGAQSQMLQQLRKKRGV